MSIIRVAIFAAVLALAVSSNAVAAGYADWIPYLVGTWTCSFHGDGMSTSYEATNASALGGNFLRETDRWRGGGGDEVLVTYEPAKKKWVSTAFEADRSVTVFEGTARGRDIGYEMVYPTSGSHLTMHRSSPTQYTIHFSGTLNGKPLTSSDVCTKHT